jgi:hypothetical protein
VFVVLKFSCGLRKIELELLLLSDFLLLSLLLLLLLLFLLLLCDLELLSEVLRFALFDLAAAAPATDFGLGSALPARLSW